MQSGEGLRIGQVVFCCSSGHYDFCESKVEIIGSQQWSINL